MKGEPVLSLILPCRNQGDYIGTLLPKYLPPLERTRIPFELIVVPNACTDATVQVVARLAQHDERIRMIELAEGGWGRAVRAGLRAAWGSVLAYTNSARTDPEVLPAFLECFLRNREALVKAQREARQAPLREIGSAIFNFEARICFGIRCRDVNGTPKIFSRKLYESLALSSTGDLFDLELIVAADKQGVPIVENPVRGFHRHGGKSSTTLSSAWKMYAGALRLWRKMRSQAAIRP
ncbi:MAG TPA: glycosyltransferase family 2 protein [Gemmataceae bacterium]|jgi:glycosyltransferase involved in cell wall biosynthesis|nr:glycosyltransferase family 2 protein [Gemmataceae bacterium]